jgi:phage/plasmid-like protein (TIGR03299 family)
MSHGIWEQDNLFSVREAPWHGLGAILDRPPKDIDEAIEKSGLGWEVEQRPLYAKVPAVEGSEASKMIKTEFFANVRSDTQEALGVVTKRYTPVQNRDAFAFLASVFQSEMHFETAGSLMNGRRAWVLMRLPEWVEVGGDPIGQYAFVSNSHDGKSSVMAAMTPIRIVCANTEAAAVRLAKGCNAQRTYLIRHTGDMNQKIAEARQVMQIAVNYYDEFKTVGDILATQPVGERSAKRFITEFLPTGNQMKERAARNREEAREVVYSIFKGAGENPETQGNAPGTYWCLYNAAVEWADYYRGERKVGRRFQRALDDPDSMKSTAWQLALTGAGLK